MITVKENELFDVCECSLLCDLVMDRFMEIGEKEIVKPVFMDLIDKINNLTRGTHE